MEKKIGVNLSHMEKSWPSPFIAREEVQNFTGGIIHPKTLANLDSQGKGPKGRFRVGRKVAYPIKEFIKWLESRAECIN